MYSSSILSYDNKLALSDIILIRHNIPDIIADSVNIYFVCHDVNTGEVNAIRVTN